MGRTHMAIGALAGLLLFPLFDIQPVAFVLLALFGALLPDVDHEKSKINRLIPITKIIPVFFKHRGFFHSVFPVVILYGAFWYAGLLSLGIPLAIGYVVHLLSDCFTRLGCNLLHPFSTFRIQGFILTDGLMEYAVFGLAIITDVALVILKFF